MKGPITVIGATRRRLICGAGVSLVLGLAFWTTQITNYSLAGTWPNFIFPPAVAVVGWIIYWAARRMPNALPRRLIRTAALPALLGGTLWVGVVGGVAATVVGLLPLFEILAESHIQEAISPDGTQMAEVYFRPVGAVGNGEGFVLIRIRPRAFPLIERQIWVGTTFEISGAPLDYLSWEDNATLYLPEYTIIRQPKYPDQIKVDPIEFQVPPIFNIPLGLIGAPLAGFLYLILRRSKL